MSLNSSYLHVLTVFYRTNVGCVNRRRERKKRLKQTYSYFVLSIRALKCPGEFRLIHTTPISDSLQQQQERKKK